MKIAFLHYHFLPGGVTTVIRHQMAALDGFARSLLITGPPLEGEVACEPHFHVSGLGYTRKEEGSPDPETLAAAVMAAIASHWPDGCDLIWVHNPLLAKNRKFLAVLDGLRRRDQQLLLQVHDFAEDGRPGVYHHQPYPEDSHYCVINARDRRLLLEAGLAPEGLHLLPNAVPPLETGNDRIQPSALPYILYPVRAIRRKNIGEAVLLAHLAADGCRLKITQPPNSEADLAVYRRWQRFTRETALAVDYEAGCGKNFADLVANARWILTTSINEGFGFSFLEPWAAGKWLQGRRLPEICTDFEAAGIRLDHLYREVAIPLSWLDRTDLADTFQRSIDAAWQRFGKSGHCPVADTLRASLLKGKTVDFGVLDERRQQEVLSQVLSDGKKRTRLATLNPFLEKGPAMNGIPEVIRCNGERVRSVYSLESYRSRLCALLGKVVSKSVRHRIDKDRLLTLFLGIRPFSLLKWGGVDDHT